MRDFVEAGGDIALQHPLVGAGGQMVDLGDRVLGAAAGAKPIRARRKRRLEERLEHQLERGLHHAVPHGRDPQPAPLAAAGLGDQPLPHGQGPKAAVLQAGPQLREDRVLAPHRLDVVGGLAIHPGRAGSLVAPHPTPPNQQERRVAHEVEQIIEPASRIVGCPSVQLGLDPQYPRLRLFHRRRRPRRDGVHRRPPGLPAPTLQACCRPSPCGRLSRPPSTTAAPPPPKAHSRRRTCPPPARQAGGKGSPERVPTFPRQPRHAYAADLRRGLLAAPVQRRRSRVARCSRVRALLPGPYPPGWSRFWPYGGLPTGSALLTPSRLASRTQAIWQCWPGPSLSGLLPPSPAPPGSGCPQLQRPAATGRRRSPFTSARTRGTSWRTTAFQYTPVASIATSATCRSASQPPNRPSPAVVVLNRSLSATTPPRGPSSRAHAATLSRCTSNPATRSYSTSMAPPPRAGTQRPAGEDLVGNRIWGSCSQRQSQVPRVLRQTHCGLRCARIETTTAPGRSPSAFHLSHVTRRAILTHWSWRRRGVAPAPSRCRGPALPAGAPAGRPVRPRRAAPCRPPPPRRAGRRLGPEAAGRPASRRPAGPTRRRRPAGGCGAASPRWAGSSSRSTAAARSPAAPASPRQARWRIRRWRCSCARRQAPPPPRSPAARPVGGACRVGLWGRSASGGVPAAHPAR